MPISSGPVWTPDPVQVRTSALAALRQATWEATSFLSFEELREYVESVLREVESDLP